MENVNSEVSEKVKSAIKAKLMELGAYVDDELPDYIMILVGNKKTKDQMDDDLSLFLGHNTERFTSWLHVVLQKLNAASMLTTTTKPSTKEKDKKVSPNPTDATDKKKHKKKKEKSEKKKDKKEKKKKKDKEKVKHSSKRKRETTDSQEAKEDSTESIEEKNTSPVTKPSSSKSSPEKEEDLNEDLVDLRPDATDLALDLEVEVPAKKKKMSLSDEEESPKPKQSAPLGLVFQVTNDKVKKKMSKSPSPSPSAEEVPVPISKPSVHDRLRPATSSGSKRIINLREESSFPPSKSSSVVDENGVMGRVVSSAIASAVRSVGNRNGDDSKRPKRLEARVRPLVSSRMKVDQPEEESPPRLMSSASTVHKRSHSEDESDDAEDEPAPKKLYGVVSKVEVAPRPRRPKNSQANTALLVRAFADAHKSVNKPNKRPLEDMEEPQPKEKKAELFTRGYQERKGHRLGSDEEKSIKKFAITVPNSLPKEDIRSRLGKPNLKKESSTEEIESTKEQYYNELENEDLEEGPEKPPHMRLQTAKKVSGSKGGLNDNTRFIVTLGGNDNESTDLRARLKAKPVRTPSLEEVEEEELIEEVEEWEEVDEIDFPCQELNQPSSGAVTYGSKLKLVKDPITKVTKKEERCVFWPACKEGDACKFIHPAKVCTTFPKCRFGDKCLFIHPKCKFDATCVKPNCPFTHSTGIKSASTTAPIAIVPVKSKFAPVPPKCRYFPKCNDANCPFTHPKNVLQICRYGKVCRTPNCQFIHPEVPSITSLKWTAPKASSGGNSCSAAVATPGTSVNVLSSLSKKLEDLNSLVKKTEKAHVNEELNKLKEMTALLESATT